MLFRGRSFATKRVKKVDFGLKIGVFEGSLFTITTTGSVSIFSIN